MSNKRKQHEHNFKIGLKYEFGEHKDPIQAFQHYKLSADAGHADAQNSVDMV